MFWKKKKSTYEILIPELTTPFDSLNEFETQKFFDWYISNIPERTAYLINVISSQGRDMQNKMDFLRNR